jgi:type IV pilus assembly protein PilQ
MNYRRVLYGCALSLALSLPLLREIQFGQIAFAQQSGNTQIKKVELVPDGDRLKLKIALAGGSRPQVFFTQQGNAWVGDITNAQLDIAPGESSFRQNAPAPGVSSLEAQQIAEDSVRLRILGESGAPQGLLSERSPEQLVFDFAGVAPQVAAEPAIPQNQDLQAPIALAQASGSPVQAEPIPEAPPETAQSPVAPPPAASQLPVAPLPEAAPEQPMVAVPAPGQVPTALAESSPQPVNNTAVNPGVAPLVVSQVPKVDTLNQPAGVNKETSVFEGQAIAPPVGDIATGSILPIQSTVDLGSDSLITLTLKDAPVADVLSLLVRRAGLNVVLNDIPPTLTISLDVQDSPLQEAFNFILRLKELKAERVDQTIFIGSKLPGVSQTLVRSFRLNQANAEGGTEGGGGVKPFLEALAAEGGPLQGVKFVTDTRTNSITAIGSPQQLDVVAAQIAQLDVRKRQALVNIKVVNVVLNNNSDLGVAVGASSGNFALSGANGAGGGSFGGTPVDKPAGSTSPAIGVGGGSGADGTATTTASNAFVFSTLNRLEDAIAVRIDAAIRSGTSKILADPKVVVSDGGTSKIDIGDDVITGVRLSTDAATGLTSREPVKETAGVTIELKDVRIDDNGFITLSVTPLVSVPGPTTTFDGNPITLLSRRQAEVERIRLKDGQTFVLAGLIQESDRVSVEKVPLLAEIPLLGALFRRQNTINDRTEVVLMLTPFILRDEVASLP